jgi:hypothetical protein
VAVTSRKNFETAVPANTEAPYLEVQPLNASGRTLASSRVVNVPRHVVIYGGSAFVPPSSGFGGVPVGCFTGSTCKFTTTIYAGHTLLAKTGTERVNAGGTGIVYFRLSGAARNMLARAKSHRLGVSVRTTDASGLWTRRSMNLVPFSTSGSGPHRSLSSSSLLSLVGTTDFVNSNGTGGILAACHASVAPCAVRATISVGRTVIARTGREWVGAGDLGYVIFSLTSAGRSMLAHAGGNQLGAQVSLSTGNQTARGQVALVRFS